MKKGTKVNWLINNCVIRGHGITIQDEQEDGTILVAVDKYGFTDESPLGFHPVIHCTVTWLTVEI